MTDLTEKEELVWRGHPSYWVWWPRVLLAVIMAAGGAVLGRMGHLRWMEVMLAAAALMMIFVFFRRRKKLYILTTQRVIEQTGVLSKNVSEVELGDIRNIKLEQEFFQRMVGIGNVELSSSAGEGVEVCFANIPKPEQVKERIRAARSRRSSD